VPFPKTSKTRAAVVVGIAATSALMIVGPGSTAATAGRLIGSAAIKNNTVRSLDIRNETITGRDVKDGSLTAKDFSGALRGATGPRGPAGPAGQDGAAGAAGATIKSWRIHYDGGPENRFTVAGGNVPTGTQVEVVGLTLDGDAAVCDSGLQLYARLGSSGPQLASMDQGTERPAALVGGGFITSAATPITLDAYCFRDNGFTQAPVPAFDATVTLAMTKRDTTATAEYN
jgi:hypothetical protein